MQWITTNFVFRPFQVEAVWVEASRLTNSSHCLASCVPTHETSFPLSSQNQLCRIRICAVCGMKEVAHINIQKCWEGSRECVVVRGSYLYLHKRSSCPRAWSISVRFIQCCELWPWHARCFPTFVCIISGSLEWVMEVGYHANHNVSYKVSKIES
jgi:hypothetical protein